MSKFPLALLLLCTILLGSCNGEPEVQQTPEVQISDDTLAVEVDSILFQEPQLIDTVYNNLQDFFGNSMCRRIRMMNADFRTYSTNKEFEEIIMHSNEMLDVMAMSIYEAPTRFKNELPQEYGSAETMALINALNEYSDSLLPLTAACGAECSEVAFFIDFESIKKPCRLTPSEADDDMVEILRRVYGVYGDLRFHNEIGWYEWWSMDAGWYTMGNDYMRDSFKMLCNFQSKFPDQFVDWTNKIQSELIDKLYIEDGSKTLQSRESIVSEFQSIRDENCFSSAQLKAFDKAMQQVETSEKILFETDPY